MAEVIDTKYPTVAAQSSLRSPGYTPASDPVNYPVIVAQAVQAGVMDGASRSCSGYSAIIQAL